jgi:hypothetical protein
MGAANLSAIGRIKHSSVPGFFAGVDLLQLQQEVQELLGGQADTGLVVDALWDVNLQ